MQNGKRNALIWLRNDLRLLDHYAFHHAAKECEGVVAYYSLNPNHFTETPWGFKKQVRFDPNFYRNPSPVILRLGQKKHKPYCRDSSP